MKTGVVSKIICITLAWTIAAFEFVTRLPTAVMFLLGPEKSSSQEILLSMLVEALIVAAVVVTLLRYANRIDLEKVEPGPPADGLVERIARRVASAVCVALGFYQVMSMIGTRYFYTAFRIRGERSVVDQLLPCLAFFLAAALFWRPLSEWWKMIARSYRSTFTVSPEDEKRQ